MREEHLVHLARVHVVARDDDELLLTVDDVEVPLVVHARDVAGVQPAAAQDEGGLARLAVVPVHEVRPAHEELAHLAGREIARAGLEVDDPRVHVRIRQADGADLPLAATRVAVRHRRGLGEPVPLDHLAAGEPLEALLHLERQRRGAGDEGLDGAQVVLREVRRGADRHVDPRRARERLGPVLLDREEDVAEIEAWDQHERTGAGDAEVHHTGQAVDVEERHDREADLTVRGPVPGPALQDVRDECLVREHRALRRAGRASGVLEDREIRGHDRDRARALAAAQQLGEADRALVAAQVDAVSFLALAGDREQPAEERREVLLDVRDDEPLHRGAGDRLLRDGIQAREDDQRLGARVRELTAQLGRRVERVDRDDHGPGAQRPVEGDDELRAVREHERDAVALRHAERLEPGREAVGEA